MMKLMLTKQETKTLVSLLEKIKNPRVGFSQEVFDALVKVVTFPSCELIIMNEKRELLLTWRHDKWWRGWHFPGGLMRYRQTFDQCLSSTAMRELGVKIISKKFLFPINYSRGPRGHAISLIYLVEIRGKLKDGKFFKTMPKNIVLLHRPIWKKVRKALKKI